MSEVAYQLARAARKAGVAIELPDEKRFEKAPTRAFNRFLDALEDEGERHLVKFIRYAVQGRCLAIRIG